MRKRTLVYAASGASLLTILALLVAFAFPARIEGFYEFMGGDVLWYYNQGKVYVCTPYNRKAELVATYDRVEGELIQTDVKTGALKYRLYPRMFSLTVKGAPGREMVHKRRKDLTAKHWAGYAVDSDLNQQ